MPADKPFPKYFYAKLEPDGDNSYFIHWEDKADAVDDDEPTEVGTYKLVSVKTYKKTITVEEAVAEVED